MELFEKDTKAVSPPMLTLECIRDTSLEFGLSICNEPAEARIARPVVIHCGSSFGDFEEECTLAIDKALIETDVVFIQRRLYQRAIRSMWIRSMGVHVAIQCMEKEEKDGSPP